MKHILTIIICILFYQIGNSQVVHKVVDLPKTTCDCIGAIALSDEPVGPVRSTHYGNELEIRNNAADDLYFFEKEHNSTWFMFKAPYTGEFILDIIAEDPKDDFNFLVFYATGRWFCKKLRTGSEVPIRSNLAHAERGIGITGLSIDGMEDYISEHGKDAFSASVQMFKDDWYYIVVDTKLKTNKGFTIHTRFLSTNDIKEMNGQFQVKAE